MTRCAGIKTYGERCRGIAKAGSNWWLAHDPARRESRRLIASNAARSKGGDELRALKERVRELYREVHAGEVDLSRGPSSLRSPTPRPASWTSNTAIGTTNDY